MSIKIEQNSTGCPKKIGLLSSVEFFGWGGGFLGVKNYHMNSGTKKIGSYIGHFSSEKWRNFCHL